jgi:methylated-DNA-[protein]-cysteine S-methyltransferase
MALRELRTPIGTLTLIADDVGLTRVVLPGRAIAGETYQVSDAAQGVLDAASAQLEAYFRGDLRGFRVPLHPQGTAFQLAVWRALEGIPYGHTTSYSAIALAMGSPNAVRAVGAANGRNPLPILVPCHRVIGKGGSLTGFGGGLPMKRFLLNLESSQLELPWRGET